MAVTNVDIFRRVLARFPQDGIRMAFAYGSGVFQQQGHSDMSKNMLDFIFAVDNPIEWHQENMKLNGSHYSFLKFFGPKTVAHVQEKFGAHMYFNTLVPCEGRLIKYGVISTQALVDDLMDWNTLYASGRLHKPVRLLQFENGHGLSAALVANHQSALHTALLTLPSTFTEEELYLVITALSYAGDFRMTIGEDKNKIANIVKPNIERFRAIYEPQWKNEQHLYWNKTEGIFQQNVDHLSKYHHLNLLPKMVLFGLISIKNRDGRNRDAEDIVRILSYDENCSDLVRSVTANIVSGSSLTQSVKGLFTAGIVKSTKYSGAKLKKMWKSRTK